MTTSIGVIYLLVFGFSMFVSVRADRSLNTTLSNLTFQSAAQAEGQYDLKTCYYTVGYSGETLALHCIDDYTCLWGYGTPYFQDHCYQIGW